MNQFSRFHDMVKSARQMRAFKHTDEEIRNALAEEGATNEEIKRVFESLNSKLSPAGCVVMPVALLAGIITAIGLGVNLADLETLFSDIRLWIVAGSAIGVTVAIIGVSEWVLGRLGKSIFAEASAEEKSVDAVNRKSTVRRGERSQRGERGK